MSMATYVRRGCARLSTIPSDRFVWNTHRITSGASSYMNSSTVGRGSGSLQCCCLSPALIIREYHTHQYAHSEHLYGQPVRQFWMSTSKMASKTVYLSLGSNLGDRNANLMEAVARIARLPTTQVLNMSSLYQSTPVHYVDQPMFLNIAVKIETSLSPLQLLQECQNIESSMGREKSFRFGPRLIDVDMLLYESVVLEDETLQLPHPRMHLRSFVMIPLLEVLAMQEDSPVTDQLSKIINKWQTHKMKNTKSSVPEHISEDDEIVEQVFCIPSNFGSAASDSAVGQNAATKATSEEIFRWNERTYVMGILNITSDSFSDGGKYESVEKALDHCRNMIREGAHIIDVGGESTRPDSTRITAEEELKRVIPVIREIRKTFPTIPISIDTFRASTAKSAVEAGANIINDISGGQYDPDMLRTVAELRVPYILMHSSGTLDIMHKITPDSPDVFLSKLRSYFASAIQRAIDAGVCRWNIIIDPGIGFGKTVEQNVICNRDILHYRPSKETPVLIGPSRKRFLRSLRLKAISGPHTSSNSTQPATELLTAEEKSNDIRHRIYGTGAAITIAIVNGANIVRVHDVWYMKPTTDIADGFYPKYV